MDHIKTLRRGSARAILDNSPEYAYTRGRSEAIDDVLAYMTALADADAAQRPPAPYPVTLTLGMALDFVGTHRNSGLCLDMEPGRMTLRVYRIDDAPEETA